MDDDSHVVDKGWDALPDYKSDGDEAVTVSISTTPGEWLVNTSDAVVVPMSMAEVVDALRAHKLTERSLVWRAGMQEWAPIERVPSLKLAARLPPSPSPSAPPPPSAATSTPSSPPGRPASKSPPPRPSAPPPPQVGLSRRATLPFGLPLPNSTAQAASRPSQPKLSSPISSPPPASEEPGVLAVYARPAATISFDLSPSEPARVPPPPPPPQGAPPQIAPPQTLAPTTSDTHRRAPRPSADLSVVAAVDFRAVQRSSKRRVWLSSLGSAAVASAVTLWLSGAAPWAHQPASTRVQTAPPVGAAVPVAAAVPAPAPSPLSVPPPAPVVSVAPVAEPLAKPAATELKRPVAVVHKPIARKPKAVSVAAAPRPTDAATSQPGSEPNPYDVKPEDSAAADPAKPAARGLVDLMQERAAKESDVKQPEAAATTGTSSPGF